jgi:lipopolysaccharide export system ATP-binding protein
MTPAPAPTVDEHLQTADEHLQTAAIEARAIKVARGEKTILRNVTIEARLGEVLGVLGPSGAGKSTLFRALVGDLAVEAGSVVVGGHDVTHEPLWQRARRGVAYVPQTPSVLWDLTVAENLRVYHRVVYGGGVRGLLGKRALPGEEQAVAERAERVDLQDRLDVRAGELSGGERRRLELARALTRPPTVLVCDEPFAGVDPQHASRLGDLLQDLARGGGGGVEARQPVAVLLADHHVAEALRVCSRAVLLLDGEVAIEADPESFREDPLVVGRYLGSWARSLPPPPAQE